MKINNLIISVFLFLVFFSSVNSEFLVDSPEQEAKRLKWNRSKEQTVTKGKVMFEYTVEEGTYCKNTKDTFKNEFVFQVPSEYLICGCKLFNLCFS